MKFFFFSGLLLLLYVYILYPQGVRLAASFRRKRDVAPKDGECRSISVIIAAHNEEGVIVDRLKNLVGQDYPTDKLEILVVSDGSIDTTVERARQSGVDATVLDLQPNQGRALAHNAGVRAARGDILVFTDAGTVFAPDFLRRVDAHMTNPEVGCVVGNLVYRMDGQAVCESEGAYWKMEKLLRNAESSLGILATGTGACMAVKREYWNELACTDDVDFITPLDVVAAGGLCVTAPDAVAYDTPASTGEQEYRTRVRQVSRNLSGTLRHWFPHNAAKRLDVTFGLLSHKILRWMSPFFLGIVLLTNLFLAGEGAFWGLFLLSQMTCYGAALVGGLRPRLAESNRIIGLCYGFCVANAGMGVGVIKGFMGLAPAVYENR